MAVFLNVCVKNAKFIQITNCIYKKYFHRSTILLENGQNVREKMFVPFQTEKPRHPRKVSVIGAAGYVGMAVSYNLLIGNYCDEIVMVDRPEQKDRIRGEVLDMLYATPLFKSPKFKLCMDYQNTKDSDLIIISAGVSFTEGQTRLDIAQTNVDTFKKFVPILAKLSPNSVMLVTSNPVDIMTYTTMKYSGFEKHRVLGTGTELDSGRFRYLIGRRVGVHHKSVFGWVIGEHGNSSVPAWSSVEVGGCKLRCVDPKIGLCDDPNNWNEIHEQVVRDGPMVMGMKYCTNWAISFTIENIARAVLNDAGTIHAVSTEIKGIHGVCTECYMSLPCVVGNRGVSKIMKQVLCTDEADKLQKSAELLDKHMKNVKF